MKQSIICLFFLSFLITSCDENMPQIPCVTCENIQEDLEPEARKVLVEEFTGVRCVQCPAGSAELENLLGIHGEQLVVVSIHAGFFSNPYNDGNDFRTDEGEALNAFLDLPEGYPTAVINRKLFENEADLQLPRTTWGGFITAEKVELSDIILDLSLDYNPDTRRLVANSTIKPVVTVDVPTRISVMVLESGVVGHQITPEGLNEEYVHKHVLRGMMTSSTGETITESLTANSTIEKSHNMVLPDDWKTDKMSVIVFVHREGESREVIQAEVADLIQ